ESYFHLASLLRGRKHPLWAARFARAGLALGIPKDRSLFVDRDICRWGLLRELSIAGFGTPYHQEALEANERLALSEGTPPALSEIAAQNAVYYAEPLAASSHVQICPTLPPNFSPCNPSIVRTDDGYRVLCRSVSYLINDYQHYISRLPDGALGTHHVLMRLDRHLALVNERDVVSDLTPIRESYIQG